MTTIMPFTAISGTKVYINLVHVRMLTPASDAKRTIVHFDRDHVITVDLPIDQVATSMAGQSGVRSA